MDRKSGCQGLAPFFHFQMLLSDLLLVCLLMATAISARTIAELLPNICYDGAVAYFYIRVKNAPAKIIVDSGIHEWYLEARDPNDFGRQKSQFVPEYQTGHKKWQAQRMTVNTSKLNGKTVDIAIKLGGGFRGTDTKFDRTAGGYQISSRVYAQDANTETIGFIASKSIANFPKCTESFVDEWTKTARGFQFKDTNYRPLNGPEYYTNMPPTMLYDAPSKVVLLPKRQFIANDYYKFKAITDKYGIEKPPPPRATTNHPTNRRSMERPLAMVFQQLRALNVTEHWNTLMKSRSLSVHPDHAVRNGISQAEAEAKVRLLMKHLVQL